MIAFPSARMQVGGEFEIQPYMSPAGMIEDILYGALTNGVNVSVPRRPSDHLDT